MSSTEVVEDCVLSAAHDALKHLALPTNRKRLLDTCDLLSDLKEKSKEELLRLEHTLHTVSLCILPSDDGCDILMKRFFDVLKELRLRNENNNFNKRHKRLVIKNSA